MTSGVPAAGVPPVAGASGSSGRTQPWWVRPGLEIVDGRLSIAGHDAEALARERGTPLFVYDRRRFAENAGRLRAALDGAGLRHRLRFALKANPDPEALVALRGLVGIDACSPGEVLRALECGWAPAEISYTGTNVSERDLDVILAHPIHLNLDAVSQIERVGRRLAADGPRTERRRSIGIRINPGAGVGYNDQLEYSGARPTKFGIYEDRLDEALAAAARYDLAIDTIHVHAGSGWLAGGLPALEASVRLVASITDRLRRDGHPIAEINVGGGLGVPARHDEAAVAPEAYAATIRRALGSLADEVVVGCEPGDWIAKDTGILLGEVVTVEERAGTTFVGLDLGWNINCSYFIYRYAQEFVLCRDAAAPRTLRATVAGHINEAGDVFAEDYPLPAVVEGDILALLNAGGYHQAMSSTHCLRPHAPGLYLDR
jgi:diaminopimelate decarboxylase